jgi:hypothetical protein
MADRSRNAGHGIIAVDERSYVVGSPEYAEYIARLSAADSWKTYFPDPDWLRDQLSRAKAAEPERLFMPWEDWGWFVERMLAYREMLEGSIDEGSTVNAALYAAELSRLTTEAQIKFKWERHALAGFKSYEGSRLGPGAKRASLDIAEKRKKLLDAYRDKIKQGIEPVIARQRAAKDVGYSDRQAKRILNAAK